MSAFTDAGGFGAVGGAVSDLFGGIAGFQEAGAYTKAATIARQNEALAGTSTQLQEYMAARQAYQTISGQKAEVAGAGFQGGGSAGDLLRSSASQAAIQKGAIQTQGAITQLGFEQQAQAYEGQAQAAQTKGSGGILGGIMKALPIVLALL